MHLITWIIHFKFLIVFLFFTGTISVNATEITWTAGNTLGADWNTPTNWDLGRVPLATDSVLTIYNDLITITTGYTAKCTYF